VSLDKDGDTSYEPLGSRDVWSWLADFMRSRKVIGGNPDLPFWGGLMMPYNSVTGGKLGTDFIMRTFAIASKEIVSWVAQYLPVCFKLYNTVEIAI